MQRQASGEPRSGTGTIPAMPVFDPPTAAAAARDLPTLGATIADCFACPRLVAWREDQARIKVLRFRNEDYWARPVPGYGDEEARILLTLALILSAS